MPLNVTLASSLLDLECEHHRHAVEAGGRTFETGIDILDRELPENIWRGGDIVGVGSGSSMRSGLRGRTNRSGKGNDSKDSSTDTSSIPLELIVTHLLRQVDGRSIPGRAPQSAVTNTDTNVFIVAPPNQATSTIQLIFTALKSRLEASQDRQRTVSKSKPKAASSNTSTSTSASEPPSTTQAKALLNHISLLQYLDTPGLIESTAEVLSQIDPASGTHQKRSILLVSGLTSTLNTTHRRSGTLQTAALLSSLLQTLRNIARSSHGLCLVLVELDISWTGGANNVNVSSEPTVPAATSTIPPMIASLGPDPGPRSPQTQPQVSLPLSTSFSSSTTRSLRISTSPVLARLLEDAMDVIVVVHDGDGRVQGNVKNIASPAASSSRTGQQRGIVECVRDTRIDLHDPFGSENAFGTWCLWM